MKRIETSKGRFIVKYYETWNELIIDANFYKLKLGVSIFKISEITEEEARNIVDYPIILEEIQGGGKMYTYYNYKLGRYDYGSSLVDSLESLLESQGIEITNNTYIFKV